MLKRLVLVLCLSLLSAAGAEAATRVALVVGNGAYESVAPLPNPTNDAAALAASLERLGFAVTLVTDLDKAAFDRAVRDFSKALKGAEVGLFFYAGHGMQVAGANYLLPVDAALVEEADLYFEAVDLNLVIGLMEQAVPTALVFLDACRDNPMAQTLARSMGTRSSAVGRGLAQVESGLGTLIAYATQPGNVALDGQGEHSPFAAALLTHIETPGLEIRQVLSRVRQSVVAATDSKQVPWDHSSLIGDFYFAAAAEQVASVPPAPAPAPGGDRQAEIVFWQSIQNSTDWRDFEAYIKRFGTGGIYYDLALSRVNQLQGLEDTGGLPAGTTFRDCPNCPEMVVIVGGWFEMGDVSNTGWDQELPVHTVIVSPFAAGKFEVTFAEWDACVDDHGCSHKPDDEGWGRGNQPVINVSWSDAQEYVSWLSQRTGKPYRLLSEAEWEYAARGGAGTEYWWGDESDASLANFASEAPKVVGGYRANPFGLHDMHGNVEEWTEDCPHSYDGATSDGSAWVTGKCLGRVIRGGSWLGRDGAEMRSSARSRSDPSARYMTLGFRLARALP